VRFVASRDAVAAAFVEGETRQGWEHKKSWYAQGGTAGHFGGENQQRKKSQAARWETAGTAPSGENKESGKIPWVRLKGVRAGLGKLCPYA
jgi:hypothetical protein